MAAVLVPEFPMNATSKCRLRLSLGVALGACVGSWLIVGETSPFADYFLWHVEIPNLWRTMHSVQYLIIMIFRPQILEEVILYVSIFVQWLLIGFVFARLVCRRHQPEPRELSIYPDRPA
jgi:hypothetical protein